MSDITQVLEQQAIADSILDDSNIVGSWNDGALAENGEQVADDRETWTDPGQEFVAEHSDTEERIAWNETDRAGALGLFGKEGDRVQAGRQAQPDPTQQLETAAQSIEEGIQALGTAVEQYQLNDPAEAKELATDLCEALGTDVYTSGINVEAIGNVMSRVGLSALAAFEGTGGDPSKVPAVPPESARQFAHDFLKSWGVDPRTVEVDAQLLSNTVFYGALNLIATYKAMGGRVTDLSRLNDPVAAEQFAGQFLRAFGVQTPIDRASALRLADAGAKHVLKLMARVEQLQPASPQRNQAGRGSGARARAQAKQQRSSGRTSRSTKFRTNADIFDDDTMAYYIQQHGRM